MVGSSLASLVACGGEGGTADGQGGAPAAGGFGAESGGATSTGGSGSGGFTASGGQAAASGGAASGGASGTGGDGSGGGAALPPGPRVIAYLYDWSGKYGDWATKIDFDKMTHINLAFCNPDSSSNWDIQGSDADLKKLVDAAHATGVKVLVSLGGGGGDQQVIARYGADNVDNLVTKLDSWVSARGLDGVDVDIEAPGQMGAAYTRFIGKLTAKLQSKGLLVTAAMAQWMQYGMEDEALAMFDYINVMAYTDYNGTVDQVNWYHDTKGVAADKIVVGERFFGVTDPYAEYAYKDILAADSNAWNKNKATVNGKTVNYSGVAEIAKITQYAKDYGGVMFWDLAQDATGEHSLYKAIQGAM